MQSLMKTLRLGPLCASVMGVVLAGTPIGEAVAEEVLVRANGVEITTRHVELAETEVGPQLAGVPARERRRIIVEYLIDNAVLSSEAQKADLVSGPKFDERVAYYRRRAMRDAYFEKFVMDQVSEADAKALYDQQFGKTEPKEEVRARHILLKTQADAADAIERINRGEDFATLAGEISTGPSKAQGGDLGYFSKGQMVKPFEEAVFKLSPRRNLGTCRNAIRLACHQTRGQAPATDPGV